MFYAFFLTILVITSVVLILAILMQSGKGGGLAANFGGAGSSSDSFLGSRQASNLLTKASWIGGGVFLALSFILSMSSARRAGVPQSVLDGATKSAPVQQAPPPPSSGSTDGLGNMLVPATGDSGKAPAAAAGAAKNPPAGKADTGKAGKAGKGGGIE